jgi:hypothetical protein
VFNDEYEERHEQADAETNVVTATAAFKMDFVFVTVKSWFDSFNETEDTIFSDASARKKGVDQSGSKGEEMPMLLTEMVQGLKKPQKKNWKYYGDQDRRVMRRLGGLSLQENFTNTDLNGIIGKYTRSPQASPNWGCVECHKLGRL